MKTILALFTGIFVPGGIQNYNRYFCMALGSQFSRNYFSVLSLCDKNKFSGLASNIHLKIYGNIKFKLLRKIVFSFDSILEVLKQRPTYVFCGHINLLPLTWFINRVFGLKYSVFVHGIEVWNLRSGNKYKYLKSADLIFAVSRYTKKRMVENGISENKIFILPDCVETALFKPKDVNDKLLDYLDIKGKKVLLTVARLSAQERYKGHDVMLRVMQRLDENYIWLIVGDGDDLIRLKQSALAAGLAKRVKFLGGINDINLLVDYYNVCHCFIMPSSGEGFGIVFLEALACGKSVIAGNKDGSSEPLMDGRLGSLIDPENVEEIIKSINLAFNNGSLNVNKEFLIAEVKKNFGFESFSRRVKDLFSEILNR